MAHALPDVASAMLLPNSYAHRMPVQLLIMVKFVSAHNSILSTHTIMVLVYAGKRPRLPAVPRNCGTVKSEQLGSVRRR